MTVGFADGDALTRRGQDTLQHLLVVPVVVTESSVHSSSQRTSMYPGAQGPGRPLVVWGGRS